MLNNYDRIKPTERKIIKRKWIQHAYKDDIFFSKKDQPSLFLTSVAFSFPSQKTVSYHIAFKREYIFFSKYFNKFYGPKLIIVTEKINRLTQYKNYSKKENDK